MKYRIKILKNRYSELIEYVIQVKFEFKKDEIFGLFSNIGQWTDTDNYYFTKESVAIEMLKNLTDKPKTIKELNLDGEFNSSLPSKKIGTIEIIKGVIVKK